MSEQRKYPATYDELLIAAKDKEYYRREMIKAQHALWRWQVVAFASVLIWVVEAVYLVIR